MISVTYTCTYTFSNWPPYIIYSQSAVTLSSNRGAELLLSSLEEELLSSLDEFLDCSAAARATALPRHVPLLVLCVCGYLRGISRLVYSIHSQPACVFLRAWFVSVPLSFLWSTWRTLKFVIFNLYSMPFLIRYGYALFM